MEEELPKLISGLNVKIKKDLNSLKLDMAIQENELLKEFKKDLKEYEELSIGGVQERDAEYTEKK
ncbi:MAG: hypothetical protein Q9M36_06845 [Sulfurovum sp.]|nr:hypothetical protein [Sulfurovum sp.]